MVPSQLQRPFPSARFLLIGATLIRLFSSVAHAQIGNDNPTGTSGVFNGNITTAGSYDPYTGNATRSVTDITVAGSVGVYPLAFTRTMNTRYTPGAGTLEFGQAGTWRHNYQWSVDPITMASSTANRWTVMPGSYTVNYPDGRRVMFGPNSPYFRAFGLSDRFQQPSNPSVSTDNCYLLLSDGGKIWFQVQIERVENEDPFTGTLTVTSTFTFQFMGLIDPFNQVTTITYPSDGSMTITEPRGRSLKLFYITTPWGGDTVLDRVVASDGRSVKYNYGGDYVTANGTVYTYLGNVVYFGDSTIVAIYTYQNDNVHPNGQPLIKWAIDCMYGGPMWAIGYTFVPGASGGVYGQLQSENYLDPSTGTVGAAVSTLSASASSRTETRGDGPSRSFNYNGAWLMNHTDFKGAPSSIGYDGNGYTASLTDARTKTTSTSREPRIGALTVVTHPGDNSTVTFGYTDANNPFYLSYRRDERDKTTSFTRNANHQVERIDYPNSGYETFSYGDFGQLTNHRMTSGGTETFYYDPRGLIYSSVNPDGTTYYFYDGNDRLENVLDPRGNRTWFQYNARGQVTRITHMDGTFIQSSYNNDGTLAWTADENHPGASTDPNQRTRYVYDYYKRVVSVTNPMNQTTQFSYALDPAWANPFLHTTKSIKYVVSPLSKNIVFDYDENFRKIHQVAAFNTADEATTLFGYDAVGNLTSVQDPRGNTATFGYDDRNRRTSATNPPPFNNEVTRWEYDYVGNLTRETRPDLLFRRMEYDPMNRVIDTYGFANEHTHYDRDPAGNVWQMIDAKGAAYGFAYDLLNRKIDATYPPDATGANRTEHWWYDGSGNLNVHKNTREQYQYFICDSRNRLTDSWWNWGGGPSVTMGYDAASRPTSVVSRNADTNNIETTVAFGYDDANRKVWEDQTLVGYPTRRVETPRDPDGNRTYLQGPGYYIGYGYTQRNQLASIGGFANFQYDKNGNMLTRQGTWIYPNNTNFAYDELNRVTQAEQGTNGWIYARSWYQYDNLGREVATWRDEQASKGERFGYDAMGQLTSAAYNADQVWTGNAISPTRTVSYNVDALNRNSVTDNGTNTGYAPNGLNQYTAVGGAGLGYDENFNVTWFNGTGYNYNSISQLTEASGNGNNAQFTYDGLGRCVRRTVNGTTRLFTYDGWKPMLEWDGAGNWVAWNIYGAGPDEILARYDSSDRVLIYKQDKRGSVVGLLDQFGNVIEKYTYDAFGQPTVTDYWGNVRSESAYGNRFMFTGREYIKELGIYDYRFRFYHPALGRFLQSDPIGFGGGDANLFRYCGGDPVNRRDPSGLSEFPVLIKPNEPVGTNTVLRNDDFDDAVAGSSGSGSGSRSGGGVPGGLGALGAAGVNFGGGDRGSSSGPSSGGNGLFGSRDSHSSDGGGGGSTHRNTSMTLGIGGIYTGALEHTYSGNGYWLGANLNYYSQNWGGNGATGARSIARGISRGARYGGGALFGGQLVVSGLNIAQNPSADEITHEAFNSAAGYLALRGGLPGFLAGTGYFVIDSTIGWGQLLDSGDPFAPVYVRGTDIHGFRDRRPYP